MIRLAIVLFPALTFAKGLGDAAVTPSTPHVLGNVSIERTMSAHGTLPDAEPVAGDAELMTSPGGDRLLIIGNAIDHSQPWVRAFDGKHWTVLGQFDQPVESSDHVVAMGADRLAVLTRSRLVIFDGSSAHTERVPFDKHCSLDAIAVDGADLLFAGSCKQVGIVVRRTPQKWIDEAITAPPLHAIAVGPAGIVVVGDRGTVAIREASGWVVGSSGKQSWLAAVPGPKSTFLLAANELLIHELRGRAVGDLVLPVPVEPPGAHSGCTNDCSASSVAPESVRTIVEISAAGGSLVVLAAVPGQGDGFRRHTFGTFAWDGAKWRDFGRSSREDNGDFVTRWEPRHVLASERTIWDDDQRKPRVLR